MTDSQYSIDESVKLPPDILTCVDEGVETAQFELGKIYINASPIQKNCDKAFRRICRSSEQDGMEAQFRLGDIYALGHGTSKTLSDAYRWYTRAALQGYKKALIRIHNLYHEDITMHCRGQINSDEQEWASHDFKKKNKIRELNEYRLEQKKSTLNDAISYYTKQFKIYQSSDQENPSVQLNLAFLYQHGYGVKKCTRYAFEYYQMAAEQGNIEAQYNLGDLYRKHTNMKFNYRHAFKWLTKSAQGGNRIAQRSLAYFYLKGLATDIHYETAFSWYTKAAEAGDTAAMVTLGKFYRKGDYIKQDLPMAVHWYTLAARKGNIVAQNCLSQLHQRGMLNNIPLEEDALQYLTESSMNNRLCTKLSTDISKLGDSPDFKQLNKLAKHALIGDGYAMYEIGFKYIKGDGDFSQDEDTGVKWIKNSAVAKHRGGQLLIAEVYKKGDSVEQDYHKAATWYRALAKQKDAFGQYNVGVMYNEGLGTRKDPLEASKWFVWAADQGNSDAQFCLSKLRFQGRGIHQDRKEGLTLLNNSARQGNIRSCYYLGNKYISEDAKVDLKENRKLGFSLLRFAAKNGFIPAQMKLAFLCKFRHFVKRYKESIITYYTMASDAGSLEAQYKLGLIYLNRGGANYDYAKAFHLFNQAKEKGYTMAKRLFGDNVKHHWNEYPWLDVIDMLIKVTEQGKGNFSYNIGYIYEYGIGPNEESFTKAREWFITASNKGDARADYRLGLIYEFEIWVDENLNEAIRYYERASRNGDTDATFRLACLYLDGRKVTQDLSKAFHYYKMASDLGHQKAGKALIVSKDSNSIFDHPAFGSTANLEFRIIIAEKSKLAMLENATDKGFTRLQYQLGVWYGIKGDHASAFKWFIRAADIGVTDAYYRVGVSYEEGRGTKQDYKMAAEMYHKATEKEHEDACYRLGRLYQYGNGVELDYLKAYQGYKKAEDMGQKEAIKVLNITLESNINPNDDAPQNVLDPSSQEYQDSLSMFEYVAKYGDTEVQFKVAFAYEYCILEPNHVEAFKWYSEAAKKSHKEAIYHLGLLYEMGLGTSQDYQRAIQLYEQAGQLGSDSAFYQLGHTYHYGSGVDIDSIKAIEYYTLSVELGNPKYQCELGKLYEEGKFVQKNLLEALKWYTRAYLQGYDNIGPELYAMYKDQPYQDFLFKKLFRNISIASLGQFRLTDNYHGVNYRDLNNRLGIFYALGYGTDKDAMKAWKYFTKRYYGYRKFEISDIFFFEYGLSPMEKGNILKALGDDEVWMNQLNREELFLLRTYFSEGVVQTQNDFTYIDDYDDDEFSQHLIIEKDHLRAFRYLKLSSDKGDPEASVLLGMVCHCGNVFDQDKEQGEMHFDSVANSGVKSIEHTVTSSHASERKQDFKKAFESYNHALDGLGNVSDRKQRGEINEMAQTGLGLLLEYGDGVEKNYQMALEYYENLADSSNPIGCHRLALMYYYGRGVSVDYGKSFTLFEKARYTDSSYIWNERLPFVYDQNQLDGNVIQKNRVYCTVDGEEIKGESYYWLGLLYNNGQGVSQDHVLAQKYFKKALDYKCERAKYEIDGYNSNSNIGS
jgi:TPR repeat protein